MRNSLKNHQRATFVENNFQDQLESKLPPRGKKKKKKMEVRILIKRKEKVKIKSSWRFARSIEKKLIKLFRKLKGFFLISILIWDHQFQINSHFKKSLRSHKIGILSGNAFFQIKIISINHLYQKYQSLPKFKWV